jgi:hypothetical protein
VWVTFRGGVYDVTEFLDAHPGGPHRIVMVAGGCQATICSVRLVRYQHDIRLLERRSHAYLEPYLISGDIALLRFRPGLGCILEYLRPPQAEAAYPTSP